jgi:MFS family permease
MLEQLNDALTSRDHWKILFTSGMGFFTDAYDLFVIGVVATIVTSEWHIASYQKSLVFSLALLTSAGARSFSVVSPIGSDGKKDLRLRGPRSCRRSRRLGLLAKYPVADRVSGNPGIRDRRRLSG